MEHERGTVLDNYRLLARVGAGACGVVWQAENIVSGELAALKILSSGDLAERELRALRLYREIDHPALIRIRHIGRAGDTFFYTMDWCDSSLAERKVRPEELPALARSLAEGLSALHSRGLLHRDVKPSNIFFRQGAPVLGDIGLLTRQEGATLAGTPGFLAPQLLSGKGAADCYSDCYALAKSLYCALSGLGPEQFPLYTGEMTPEASLLMRAAIAVCSEPPAIRTADEFLHFLNAPAPVKRKRRLRLWITPLLAALCGIGFFLLRPRNDFSPMPGQGAGKRIEKRKEKREEKRTVPEKQPETDVPAAPPSVPAAPPSVPAPVSASPSPKAGKKGRDPVREEIERKFTALPPEAEAKLRRITQNARVYRLLGNSGRLRITEEEEKGLLPKLTPEQGKIWLNGCTMLRKMQVSAKWRKAAQQWRSKELDFKSRIRKLEKERDLDAPAALRRLCKEEPLLAFWSSQGECLYAQEELMRAAEEKTPPDLTPLLHAFSEQTEACLRRFSALSL